MEIAGMGYEKLLTYEQHHKNTVEYREDVRGASFAEHLNPKKVPYSYLAENGVINYKGIIFNCDSLRNRICLGDTSDSKNCLNIPLSEGGSLVVNVNNLGDLSKAIGMFSAEDTRRILEAMAKYKKSQEIKNEIEEDVNSIGTNLDKHTGGEDKTKEL